LHKFLAQKERGYEFLAQKESEAGQKGEPEAGKKNGIDKYQKCCILGLRPRFYGVELEHACRHMATSCPRLNKLNLQQYPQFRNVSQTLNVSQVMLCQR